MCFEGEPADVGKAFEARLVWTNTGNGTVWTSVVNEHSLQSRLIRSRTQNVALPAGPGEYRVGVETRLAGDERWHRSPGYWVINWIEGGADQEASTTPRP
jgi:hypothetical protein